MCDFYLEAFAGFKVAVKVYETLSVLNRNLTHTSLFYRFCQCKVQILYTYTDQGTDFITLFTSVPNTLKMQIAHVKYLQSYKLPLRQHSLI